MKNDKPIDILHYIKIIDYFSYAYITYRIMLTIPLSITSAERDFSTLKIIKTYLKSTIFQDRLNELNLLSMKKYMLNEIMTI